MIIKRYIKDKYLERLQQDFAFLPGILKNLYGEIDLALRDNYFNLYYRGNSIAKVVFKRDGRYEVLIHNKFYNGTSAAKDKRFKNMLIGADKQDEKLNNSDESIAESEQDDKNGTYIRLDIDKNLLHPLLQRKYLVDFSSKVKSRNFSEELTLEQMIISDNSRDDLILIDRQVTDTRLKKRMDLLALKQRQDNQYSFLVIEVKMGSNPELAGKVADQLEGYLSHIEKYFSDYKACYEENYRQKKVFGLIDQPAYQEITIVPGVEGMVVVGGYSGLAAVRINTLIEQHPALNVQQLNYRLNTGDGLQ